MSTATEVDKEKAAKRRRDKVQLSCNLCRKRKQPCWNCSSRGLASSCSFPENSNVPAGPVAATKAASFQDRINHLEGLVVQLLQQQQDETPGSKLPKLCAKCSGPLEQRPGSSPSAATPHTSSSAAPMVTIDQVNASTAAIARNFSLPPATPSASHVHSTLDVGRLQIDSVKSAYVSSPHWTAVLNGLSELKTFWEAPEEEDAEEFFPGDQSGNQYYKTESGAREETPLHMLPVAPSQQPKTRRFQLLYGEHREQTLEEILLVVPPRDVVDRLVLLYFNNLMLPLAVFHSGSFLSQYEKFWENPHETPILWISMLFGIMSVASQTEAAWALYAYGSSTQGGVPQGATHPLPLTSPFPDQTPPYVEELVACLIKGEYTKGGAFAIEALLHYQFIEVANSPDVHADAWMVSGIVTRLAYRMGYHRDPSHFPNITPFEGEIRRRLWISVHAMDTMISAQMGLPRLIKAGSWDTEPPRNLQDADLSPNCAVLPPERPFADPTPTLHLIAKHHLFAVIGLITDMNMTIAAEQTLPLAPPSAPRHTLARERELTRLIQDTYDGLPDKCKFHSMLGCIADKAFDIIHRIGASALLQKGLIAIHWHRLMLGDAPGEDEELRRHEREGVAGRAQIRESYAVCIHAALRVLGFQSLVESESNPGGALFPQRIQATSVIKHEFLTSTVVLCRHMYRVAAGPDKSPLLRVVLAEGEDGDGDAATSGDAAPVRVTLPEAHVVEAALRHSRSIWRRSSCVSSEAKRISSILDALFAKLGSSARTSSSPSDVLVSSSSPFDGSTAPPDIDPGLALLDEFGLLHHLLDMNNYFEM